MGISMLQISLLVKVLLLMPLLRRDIMICIKLEIHLSVLEVKRFLVQVKEKA